MNVAGVAFDTLAQHFDFRIVPVCLCEQGVHFLVIKDLVDIALRHESGQAFFLLAVFHEQGLQLLNPVEGVVVVSLAQRLHIGLQDQLSGEDQLVDHRDKGSLQCIVSDELHGTFAFVVEVCVASPDDVFVFAAVMRSALEDVAALTADDLAGEAVPVQVFATPFDDAFFFAVLTEHFTGCCENLLAS